MTTDPGAPARSVEIELKFDVDDSTSLPGWSQLPGVAAVDAPELRELDAVYFDSRELALAQAGYAVRRRTGGPDEGWHIKGPRGADGGRLEQQWPLGDAETIPDAVAAALPPVSGIGGFAPIARIRNRRLAYVLRDGAGQVVAEFVDDHVVATDERTGTERTWREWEFELGPAAPVDPDRRAWLLRAAEEAVEAVGGRPAASASKLARALGV